MDAKDGGFSTVLFLPSGTQCDHAIGTALRVTYTEREGIKEASRVVRAE